MKRALIFCYLAFLITISIISPTLKYFKHHAVMWIGICGIVISAFAAISILLYGISYKPKRFIWFWKIIPFLLVGYFLFSWRFVPRISFDDQGSRLLFVAGMAFAAAILFPEFYMTFRFGYPKSLPREKKDFKFVIFISLITCLCVGSSFFPRNKLLNIKVNYVAEYNKLSQPKDYDPNKNAACDYEKAFAALVAMPNDIAKIQRAWPGDLNDAAWGTLKNWLALNSQALEHFKSATQKPYYWVERNVKGNFLLGIEMPELLKLKSVVYAFAMETKLIANQGQTAEALKQTIDLYKMAEHLNGPKSLIEQLVALGINGIAAETGFQILYRTNPSSELLEDFQKQLQRFATNEKFMVDFSTERLVFYDCVQRTFTDDGKGDGHIYGTRAFENKSYLSHSYGLSSAEEVENLKGLRRRQTIELAQKFYQYVDEVKLNTPGQLHKEGKDIQAILQEMAKSNYLMNMLAPAIAKVLEVSYRAKVNTDALITTCGILRYKAKNGQLPETLEELVSAGYIQHLPMDPLGDGPLVYRADGNDFILYSFGEDFDDDGGVYSRWGADSNGGDQVFWPVKLIEKQNQ